MRLRATIVFADADHRAHRFEQVTRMPADLGAMIAEVAHFTGQATRDPIGIAVGIGRGISPRNTRQFKAALGGQGLDCRRIYHSVQLVTEQTAPNRAMPALR